MEKKSILKNTSFLLFTQVIQFFTGVIKSKLNALIVGTAGTGIYSQLSTFTSDVSTLSLLGMNGALVKQIAESKNTEKAIDILLSALKLYVLLASLFTLIVTMILVVFNDFFVRFFFGSNDYRTYFFIGILSVPLLIIQSIPYAIMQGFKGMKHISLALGISVIINILLFIPLVSIFELDGVVLFFPISYLIILLIHFYFANKYYLRPFSITIKDIYLAKTDFTLLSETISFAGVGLFSGIAAIISDLICRSLIVNKLGIDNIGLYSPNVAWAGLFTGFLLPSLRTYLYPRFCEISKEKDKINGVLNDSLRISTYFYLPLLFIIVPFRKILIPLLYSNDFSLAASFMPFHFLGVLVRIWWHQIMLVFTPLGSVKLHGLLMILFSSLDLLIVYIFVPILGLWGWTLKFLIGPVVFFVIYGLILVYKISFSIKRENLTLGILVLLGAIGQILLTTYYDILIYEIAFGMIIMISSFLLLSKTERNKIISIILRYTKIRNADR